MSRLNRLPWITLPSLLMGYALAGCLLSVYSASSSMWLLIEAMILYLAWVGTGAIALSVMGVLSMMWAATLFTPCPPGMLFMAIHLTAAQGWAIALTFSWVLAMGLVFKLAFTVNRLNTLGFSRFQTFWLLVLMTNIGLKMGQLLEMQLF